MPGLATVKVARNDGSVSTGSAQVESVAPGLFSASATGAGAAAAIALKVSADGSRTSQLTFLTPIDLGSETDQVFLSLFGTGIRGRSSLAAVDVKIGSQNVPVLYAGPQNEFEGLDQVDAGPLPRTLAGRGEIEIILTVDDIPANVVTINVP
jgi:uncharacterized protein (TIGR03437 family)